MSDHRNADQPGHGGQPSPSRDASTPADPIELIDECLAAFPDGDPRQKLLYKLRHVVTAQSVAQDRRDTELKKLNEVVAKLTAPANRVGLLVEVPAEGVARIVVGGAEYYANIDPRLAAEELKIGAQILVNEAYTVIKALEYDRNGPVLKVAEILPDGRIRFEQDMGRQALILQRSATCWAWTSRPVMKSASNRHTGLPLKSLKIGRRGPTCLTKCRMSRGSRSAGSIRPLMPSVRRSSIRCSMPTPSRSTNLRSRKGFCCTVPPVAARP